ncbi:hypothetical protein [Lederbergia citrea]|uniref:Uncharacterized protein n=1 Tax=Lederbergia citrea TaxID=2833581 RepID=A0A942Z3T7_9BACI|nr:hypothetical protein [Lederbergia citrea]MBS4221817.1 hypothetical protein [Lederbergia citrea]
MTLNYKRAFGYLAYTFGFVLLLVFISNINLHFSKMIDETFKVYPWQILKIMMYFPIGIYLGIPKFLLEFNKTGNWRINFYKIVLVALPMIYISFYWFFPFSYPILNFLTYTGSTFSFGTIIAGFIIINSFTKE